MIGQRKLLKWTVPGAAHAATFWGFIVLLLTIIEAYGDLFSKTFAIPGHRPLGVHRLHRGPVRRRGAGGHHHVRGHPAAQQPGARGPGVPVLRQPHGCGVAGAGRDFPGHRHAADLPGRADQHRRLPLSAWRVRLADRRALAGAAGHRGEQGHRDRVPAGPAGRGARVPGLRDLLQAPAHHHRAGQRAVLPPPERAGRPGADAQRRQGAGLRGSRPGHRRVRPGQDRGLHLEGPAGHGHLHRVRAVPVPVSRLGHRQAAVTQAGDPGPA